MTFSKQRAPAISHTRLYHASKNQPQPSQEAGSQDTSSLERKKNAQPFYKYRRPWHKLRAQEQSQSTWKTAAAVLTAACLTGEPGHHPSMRDSLQAPDKLHRMPLHRDRSLQCQPHCCPNGASPSVLTLVTCCSSSKASEACWLSHNEPPSNRIFQVSRISVSGID